MKLVFLHGWSSTNIDTYGELPEVLKREAPEELNLEIENIYLGEYISFHDEVTLSHLVILSPANHVFLDCFRKE